MRALSVQWLTRSFAIDKKSLLLYIIGYKHVVLEIAVEINLNDKVTYGRIYF